MKLNHSPDHPKEVLRDCFHLSARGRIPGQVLAGCARARGYMQDREGSTSPWEREKTRLTVGCHPRQQGIARLPFQRGQTRVWVMSGRSQRYRP